MTAAGCTCWYRRPAASCGGYANPHSFRNTLAMLGEKLCATPEDFKAWSQNLGHEHVLTTFTSYGAAASRRQAQIFDQLRAA